MALQPDYSERVGVRVGVRDLVGVRLGVRDLEGVRLGVPDLERVRLGDTGEAVRVGEGVNEIVGDCDADMPHNASTSWFAATAGTPATENAAELRLSG